VSLQVTAAGVWVLDRQPDRQLVHSWTPQGEHNLLLLLLGQHCLP
jgi:hypothetical protein